MKPTKEQTKRLWKWCGWYTEKHPKGWDMWYDPNGHFISNNPPVLDLNNLFKWAVMKLNEELAIAFYQVENGWVCEIHHKGPLAIADTYDNPQDSPALALFWAINQLIEEEK